MEDTRKYEDQMAKLERLQLARSPKTPQETPHATRSQGQSPSLREMRKNPRTIFGKNSDPCGIFLL